MLEKKKKVCVKMIKEDGSVAAFNEENPNDSVKVGDEIVEVSGVKAKVVSAVIAKIGESDFVVLKLKRRVRHGSNPEHSPTSSAAGTDNHCSGISDGNSLG